MKFISAGTLTVLGLNALHFALTGAAINASHSAFVVGLIAATAIPIVTLGVDLIRGNHKNYTLYAGLFGTGFLWAPVYLATFYETLPRLVLNLTFAGVGLLVLWAILPFMISRARERG